MPLIEWQDRFKVGIADVDHEHQSLIGLINDLYEEMKRPGGGGASGFFGDLYAAISSHFALEERIMRQRGYDQYREHKADHEALLDQIRDIMDDFESGGHQEFEAALAERLEKWFTRHFQSMDARLHKLLGSLHG